MLCDCDAAFWGGKAAGERWCRQLWLTPQSTQQLQDQQGSPLEPGHAFPLHSGESRTGSALGLFPEGKQRFQVWDPRASPSHSRTHPRSQIACISPAELPSPAPLATSCSAVAAFTCLVALRWSGLVGRVRWGRGGHRLALLSRLPTAGPRLVHVGVHHVGIWSGESRD